MKHTRRTLLGMLALPFLSPFWRKMKKTSEVAGCPLFRLLVTDEDVEKYRRELEKTIYNVENTVGVGKPISVYDATGKQHYHTYECCVESGRIIKARQSVDGKILWCDPKTEEVIRDTIYAPAPLVVKPAMSEGDTHPSGKDLVLYYEGCTCKKYYCSSCPAGHFRPHPQTDEWTSERLFRLWFRCFTVDTPPRNNVSI